MRVAEVTRHPGALLIERKRGRSRRRRLTMPTVKVATRPGCEVMFMSTTVHARNQRLSRGRSRLPRSSTIMRAPTMSPMLKPLLSSPLTMSSPSMYKGCTRPPGPKRASAATCASLATLSSSMRSGSRTSSPKESAAITPAVTAGPQSAATRSAHAKASVPPAARSSAARCAWHAASSASSSASTARAAASAARSRSMPVTQQCRRHSRLPERATDTRYCTTTIDTL
jgi:hypothetical protein